MNLTEQIRPNLRNLHLQDLYPYRTKNRFSNKAEEACHHRQIENVLRNARQIGSLAKKKQNRNNCRTKTEINKTRAERSHECNTKKIGSG